MSETEMPLPTPIAHELDRRVLGITPNIVVEWGYNLWVADTARPGSKSQTSATKSIDQLEALADTFVPASREQIYLIAMRLAATSFARGIAGRKANWREEVEAAREHRARMIKNYSLSEFISKLATVAFKLVLVGGVLLALGSWVLGYKLTLNETQNFDWKTLASVLGVGLLGALFRMYTVPKKLDKIFKRFEKARETADERYVTSVVKEYKLAAETASVAWRELTGTPSQTTAAFECLLMSVLDADIAENSKSDEDAVEPAPVKRRFLQPSYWLERITDRLTDVG